MADESYVQLAADGVGKKVRNLSATIVQADGSLATVQMQVVALADGAGNFIDLSSMAESVYRQRQICALLLLIVQAVSHRAETPELDDINQLADLF